MNGENELTPEDEEILEQMGYGYPRPEEKHNIFSFFKKIVRDMDNTKTGNLVNEEIGMVRTPVRTNKELSLYCDKMGMKGFSDYFADEAQIILGSSLSRDGTLIKLAITQKREVESKTRRTPPRTKGGLFAKKQPVESQAQI